MRSELIREPSKAYIRKIFVKTYADAKAEEETGQAKLYRPHVSAPLLPHSYASASVVTDIIVKKFADALPLYRQEQMWKRLGVDLKRNTMSNWVIQIAELYLKPFSDAFLAELLRQKVIHADETVLQVNKEPGRDATAESRIWAYASSKRVEHQIRYFRYEESRKGACAEKVLGGYTGVVISDGYSGYNILSKAIRAGCWAHARRKWVEAMPQGATRENALAAKGLEYCSRLFEAEQKLEKLTDRERLEQRRLLSRPIVDEYYAWLQTIFKPAGKLKKAVTYSLNQREYLCAFLDHGEIEISNNQVENAIRPIVVGRKNWLFCDTQADANAKIVALSNAAVKGEELPQDEQISVTDAMDVMIRWFCLLFGNQFSPDDVLDGYPVDRLMHDIALALMAVQTQTTEILSEFPTKAAKEPASPQTATGAEEIPMF